MHFVEFKLQQCTFFLKVKKGACFLLKVHVHMLWNFYSFKIAKA